jgi:hypothetical protein
MISYNIFKHMNLVRVAFGWCIGNNIGVNFTGLERESREIECKYIRLLKEK